MGCCGVFDSTVDAQFTPEKAAHELARYRRKGPGVTTKLMRDALTATGALQGTLLDVGAGIGALTFELLDRGVTGAVAVDASRAYLAAAEEEAASRGRSQSVSFVHGDFAALADGLPKADTVTLDRVVCCYPSFKPLLEGSLQHATRTFAFSYPRDRWFVRGVVRLENAVRRLSGNLFRTVVHPAAEMQQVIASSGFELVSRSGTMTWAVEVYSRSPARTLP